MSSRKIFNYDSIILHDLTLEKEGYSPDQLGPSSAKFIWAVCRFCGEPSRIRKGFFNKSGSACHKQCRMEEQRRQKSPFNDPAVREKAKKTNLERYGHEYASSNKEVAAKISAVKQTPEYKAKVAQTNLARHGVVNVFESNIIKEQIKQTNLERYEHLHAMQNAEVQDKTKQTLRDRYGVDNLVHYDEFKQKSMQGFQDHVAHDTSGKYALINILRSEAFWEELAKPGMALSIVCKKFNLPYQSTASTLSRPEFKTKFQEIYSFPKVQQQNEIKTFLQDYGFHVILNDKKTMPPYELDIYVPDIKFAVEFNGSYWHSEACLDSTDARNKHRRKLDECRKLDIRLFNIFEHQWQARKPQMLNFIKSIINKNDIKIHGRKCSVTYDPCKQFLDDNHIQGYGTGTVKFFNLVYEGEIVASMTGSKHHRQNASAKAVVLNRLCFKDGVNVQGGSSKLFKHFVQWARDEGYESILSWSDNCWTEGRIYKILGFDLIQEYGPDYFYWDMGNRKYASKQSQKKSNTGCPKDVTERVWCADNGLFRIWDCGKKKWQYLF